MRFYYGTPRKSERAECIKTAYKSASYIPDSTVDLTEFYSESSTENGSDLIVWWGNVGHPETHTRVGLVQGPGIMSFVDCAGSSKLKHRFLGRIEFSYGLLFRLFLFIY